MTTDRVSAGEMELEFFIGECRRLIATYNNLVIAVNNCQAAIEILHEKILKMEDQRLLVVNNK